MSNGSTDRTEEVVRQACEIIPTLRLLVLPGRGKGLAVRAGVLEAVGDVVFLCDADLSMPPDTLGRFLSAMESVDVVVGSREAPGAKRYDEPWQRHVMGRIFNRLVKVLAIPDLEDTQCGFKAFSRTAAQAVFPLQTLTGFGFDVEILYLSRKFGFSMHELGIDWFYDSDSRVRPGIDSLRMFGEVLIIRLRDMAGMYRLQAAVPQVQGEDRVG